jgi:hypothetical protein
MLQLLWFTYQNCDRDGELEGVEYLAKSKSPIYSYVIRAFLS